MKFTLYVPNGVLIIFQYSLTASDIAFHACSLGAAVAIYFSEYLIHLPLFNVLLGFPIQLLGLLSIPVRANPRESKRNNIADSWRDARNGGTSPWNHYYLESWNFPGATLL